MTQSLMEAAAGITQEEIEKFLKDRGKDPADYSIYPFRKDPYILKSGTVFYQIKLSGSCPHISHHIFLF